AGGAGGSLQEGAAAGGRHGGASVGERVGLGGRHHSSGARRGKAPALSAAGRSFRIKKQAAQSDGPRCQRRSSSSPAAPAGRARRSTRGSSPPATSRRPGRY